MDPLIPISLTVHPTEATPIPLSVDELTQPPTRVPWSKLLFTGEGSRDFTERIFQKVKEYIIAVRLERHYTKDEIIAQYLNIYDFNNNADGIKLVYRVTDDELRIEKQSDNNIFLAADRDGGQLELYHNNDIRLSTTGLGITVFGTTQTQQLNVSGFSTFLEDITVGTSATVGFGTNTFFFQTAEFLPPTDKDGLIIDIGDSASTGSHIKLMGVGPQTIDFRGNFDAEGVKFLYDTSNNLLKIQKSDDDDYIFFTADRDDGKVEIGHGGTKKLETTASGIDITGTLKVSGISTFGNTIELDGALKDVNDDIGFSDAVGVCKTDYRLSSVGTGVSWRPSGVQTKRTIWVSVYNLMMYDFLILFWGYLRLIRFCGRILPSIECPRFFWWYKSLLTNSFSLS